MRKLALWCGLWAWTLMTIGCAAPNDFRHTLDLDPFDQLELDDHIVEALEDVANHQLDVLSPDVVCAQCHERQAQEYGGATMRYGFISPSFNALELSLNQLSDGRFAHHSSSASSSSLHDPADPEQGSAFCSDCHGPAAISRGLHVNGREPTRAQLSIIEAREGGIGCDFCHTAHAPRGVSEGMSATPSRDKLSAHRDPAPNIFHGYRRPQDREGYQLTSSQFCAPCHDVRPRQPDVVTNQSQLRSEDLFSEWSQSPWADADHPLNPMRGQRGITGIHDDAEQIMRGERVTCQDCHMSLYPQRTLSDEITYEEHFSGVDHSELTRKAHKLYPAARVAARGHSNSEDESRRRRVSTHYFTGVSHPLTPFKSSDIFNLDALNLGATDRAPDTLGPWRDQREMSADEWRSSWFSWRAEESGTTGAWGEPRAAHERRAHLLKAALTLSLDEVPTEASRGEVLTLDAWIENTGAGHNVPAGFSQEREVWVDIALSDHGRSCDYDAQCQDLLEPPRFLDNPNRYCVVHDAQGERDPALPENGAWEAAGRAERSGVCGSQGYCTLYRSGYLIDRDGDGLTHDEDLRHVLVERDIERFEERCVLSGPDADVRLRGVERGLVHFTNALQRVAVNEEDEPIEHPNVALLAPKSAPFDPFANPIEPLIRQDPKTRRSYYPTERALYEQSRYRPAPLVTPQGVQRGLGLSAPTLLSANRAFNGHALKPLEPRLARYQVKVPIGVEGPLMLEVKVRFRFFSPRLLRTLITRHPQLMREEMIDTGLEIIDMAQGQRRIEVRD